MVVEILHCQTNWLLQIPLIVFGVDDLNCPHRPQELLFQEVWSLLNHFRWQQFTQQGVSYFGSGGSREK